MPAGHPGLLANQTLSDEYCRPSRYKLRLCRLGDRLFICMILFCIQYVINLYTQSTSKIKCVSDSLCLYQRSEVIQSCLERSAIVF